MSDPFIAPTAPIVFYRSYSRQEENGTREDFEAVFCRCMAGLAKLGNFTQEEFDLVWEYFESLKVFPSGRWLFVGGTEWLENPINYHGVFNCTSREVISWETFGELMDLSMQGSGTGAVLESRCISQLPPICNHLKVEVTPLELVGSLPKEYRISQTIVSILDDSVNVICGDSRQGWVRAYQTLLEVASNPKLPKELFVNVDLTGVRAAGERLKGFGGVANPIKLPQLFTKVADILNEAIGRQLTDFECCLLLDEAALAVVAGNIRRSASMRQFDADSDLYKQNLWIEENGQWKIDPKREAMRMGNHTCVFHFKPVLEECIGAVREQWESGEGAIQWAGEAVARANADLLQTPAQKTEFLTTYEQSPSEAGVYLQELQPEMSGEELDHRLHRYGLNPCGEIIGKNMGCNLAEIHLNQLDPFNFEEQENAFKAGALTCAALLQRNFITEPAKSSREIDPIVGVSFTGLFDFFVKAFGVDWLRWWEAGRPEKWYVSFDDGLTCLIKSLFDDNDPLLLSKLTNTYKSLEQAFLTHWRQIVEQTVWQYCDRHNLKRPNRCTTVQPSGSKSLLTGASPGWHPPIASTFIRRITIDKNHPIALAAIDLGYTVVPAQDDKDEQGNLLNDPFDPRVKTWLIELPVQASWANLPGAEKIDISKFSAEAQFDFYMQVQKFYTGHNTSATISLREHEIESLGTRIYEAIRDNEGYISAALLARFDDRQSFPRLPFEPISKEQYEQMMAQVESRRVETDFYAALSKHDQATQFVESQQGPAGCDSDKCLLPDLK